MVSGGGGGGGMNDMGEKWRKETWETRAGFDAGFSFTCFSNIPVLVAPVACFSCPCCLFQLLMTVTRRAISFPIQEMVPAT